MSYAEAVMVGALLVVALAALSIETQVRAIRRLLEAERFGQHTSSGGTAMLGGLSRRDAPAGAGVSERDAGFVVWSFQKGEWVQELACPRDGFVPGPPPARPGRYEGECVRTLCVPAGRRS